MSSQPKTSVPLILYGDGVHDDTEALEAYWRRRPVYRKDGKPLKLYGLAGLTCKITRTLEVHDGDELPEIVP